MQKTVQAQGTGAMYDVQSLKEFKKPKKAYKQVATCFGTL